jgi:hypothetical protein
MERRGLEGPPVRRCAGSLVWRGLSHGARPPNAQANRRALLARPCSAPCWVSLFWNLWQLRSQL